ncbi:MAG: hypothetical protein RL266_440 [Bacteroidota bacterium]
MKKWLIVASVLVVLLGGGAYYWHTLQTPTVISDPVDAIPTSAVLVVSYPNINTFWNSFEEKDYYEDIYPVAELQRYFSRNELFDSIVRYDQSLKEFLAGSVIWSSYHLTGSDSLQVFHSIQPSSGSETQVFRALNAAFLGAGSVSAFKMADREGITLELSEPRFVMHFVMANGLILSSNSKLLLKNALEQLQNGRSLRQQPAFTEALNAAGQHVEANVFINYALLPSYLTPAMKPVMQSARSFIGSFASWSELDVTFKPDGLSFNGFTYTSDSSFQFLKLFLDQKPQNIEFPDHLPSNTASFVFYGIDDVIAFSSDYRNLLNSRGTLKLLESNLDSLNTQYGVDLEQNLLAWMGNSFGVCITEPRSVSFAEETYWVFEARSTQLAAKLLGDLSTTLSEKNGTEKFLGTYNGAEIGQLPLQGIITVLLGDGYEDFANPYYTISDDHVVFGTSEQAMQRYLQYIQADRTLAKELSFSRFLENLSSTFNMFTYHHIARSKDVFNSYLNNRSIETLNRNRKVVSAFEALGTQLTSTGKSFYSNMFLRYDPNWQEADESYWNAVLESPAQTRPIFVKNHLSGENEVLVQDENNRLYLFNSSGQELFKRELAEPILSNVTQVDAFKNGKLQYIFNTKNFIYLIDREGNNVDGFPIELTSPAETELAVIEYDRKKDYRLLIACKNKHIYNYEISGKKAAGWLHDKATDPTIHAFQHLVFKGKDYLITAESNGKIHLLDRRGKNRVKVEKRVIGSKNNQLQVFQSTESALVGAYLTDENGLIHRVALDGDIRPMDLGKHSPEHIFLVSDLDGDGGPEFIFHDLNMLQVFNYKKEKLFEQRTDPSAGKPLVIDLGNGKRGVGFAYKDSEQLVLFGPKGEMLDGFPLSGNSDFSLLVNGTETTVVSAGPNANLMIQTLK